ncbi:MAG: 23S rRNA (guanosine(2251)-2'-O)-methyltransferase RlmB [Mycoplasmoidaceae bacterium]
MNNSNVKKQDKIIIGKKVILEYLKNDNKIISIHSYGIFRNIKNIALEKNIPYIIHENASFLNKYELNNQNIIAFIKANNFLTSDFDLWYEKISKTNIKNKLILILDSINDVGNFGSIIRTSNCFGVNGIIIKKNNQSPINHIVEKISKGTIYNSNILQVSNLSNIINKLKKLNFWIISSNVNAKKSIYDIDYNFNCCLIIGNEEKGVSENITSISDFNLLIPMYGIIDSLNVVVATGIILSYIKYKNN